MSKIEIRNLYLIFGKEKHKAEKMLKEGKTKEEILKATGCTVAVKDANLSINEGEIFVIMGLSGSGKSTLLRCINRLIRPTSGEIIINDTDISSVRSSFSAPYCSSDLSFYRLYPAFRGALFSQLPALFRHRSLRQAC